MAQIKFGTDGVRGKANSAPIDAPSLYRIGQASASIAGPGSLVFIGRDTRASGPMLETALSAGLASGGVNAMLAGVVPSAAIGLAVREHKAALGIMLTASHNPAADNGVKFFGRSGDKLDDADQNTLQDRINAKGVLTAERCAKIGQTRQTIVVSELYTKAVMAAASGAHLQGMHLVVDCANGSASFLAPQILRNLGARVTVLHGKPDGKNINLNCGSTHPQSLQERVTGLGADVGIAFDGDADRVLLVDEKGGLVDGDLLLACLARDWAQRAKLRSGAVVATKMSNLGLEKFLRTLNLPLHRTAVGDRHVAAKLDEIGGNLGGEQSGHLRLPELCPSGDGLIAAVAVLKILSAATMPASTVLRPFEAVPQFMQNIAVSDATAAMKDPGVKAACEQAEALLGTDGRLLVRPSGTEPLIRVMAECADADTAHGAIKIVVDAIEVRRT